MKSKTIAKAAIINHEGLILLLRRSATDTRRPGEWDFPGGGIDPGEDVGQGVAREIHEEAGLSIEITDLTLIYAATEPYETDESEGTSNTRLLYICHIDRAQSESVVLSSEHDAYEWVTIGQALTDFKHWFYNPGLAYARDHDLI